MTPINKLIKINNPSNQSKKSIVILKSKKIIIMESTLSVKY
jgi:hypothetical protein